MIGLSSIGEHAIGEFIEAMSAPLVFEPISRILSGGTFQAPAYVPTVIELWFWNDGTLVLWNDEDVVQVN